MKPYKSKKRLLLLLCLSFIFPLSFSAQNLEIGLAHTVITPPIGSPMAGYGARVGVAESVHDPLLAKALVVEGKGTSLALITFDLRRMASAWLVEEIKKLGIQHVILTSSHTHSGPNADFSNYPDEKKPYRKEMLKEVLKMVKQARKNRFSASIGVGRNYMYLGHNRRLVDEEGKVKMFWRNEERKPTWPVDPTVGVIRIADDAGKTRAILVNYALHPVVLGPDNLAISADFPGAMRNAINDALGTDIEVFFLQGACGDINPFQDKQPVDERGFEIMEQVGKELAEAVVKTEQQLSKSTQSLTEMKILEKELVFEHRWEKGKTVPITLSTVLFNDEIALATMPGELFVELQMNLRDRSPLPHTFFVGYSINGPHPWPDYIPTMQAAMEGGYGANARTHIEVGAGEVMVDQAVISIFSLLGKLDFSKGY